MASAKGSILVTGTNGGLGSAIVGQILRSSALAKDYHGIYTVRKTEGASVAKVTQALQSAAAAQHRYDLVALDLSSLASVRKAAEDINKRVASGHLPPIRALILCAGWQEWETHTITDDGFDMSFQANYLGHFLLTLLLLQSMDKENGRIIVLSSWTHNPYDPNNKMGPTAPAFEPEEFKTVFKEPLDTEPLARGRWNSKAEYPEGIDAPYRRYGAAKTCEVMMWTELTARLAEDPALSRIAALAVDPGAMPSDLSRTSIGQTRFITNYILPWLAPLLSWLQPNGAIRTCWKSAGDVIRAAFDTEQLGEHPTGLYLNGTEKSEAGPEARDRKKTALLWHDGLGYAQIKEGDTILANWQ